MKHPKEFQERIERVSKQMAMLLAEEVEFAKLQMGPNVNPGVLMACAHTTLTLRLGQITQLSINELAMAEQKVGKKDLQ